MKAIVTKYAGPSNTRGARILASAEGVRTLSVPFDYGAADPHVVAARALCARQGWTGTLIGPAGLPKGGYAFVWEQDTHVEVGP